MRLTTSNQPLILTKWEPNLSVSKDEVTKVLLWVKVHKGRIGYAWALIEVEADNMLKEEITMAVPLVDGTCHSRHDRFTVVTSKKKKAKAKEHNAQQFASVKLNPPKTTLVWSKKDKPDDKHTSDVSHKSDGKSDRKSVGSFKNQFSALQDFDDILAGQDVGQTSDHNELVNEAVQSMEVSDSEVDEELVMEQLRMVNVTKGASTPSNNVFNVYICGVLESHVDLSSLSKICSNVFRSWDWISNVNQCVKGCQIIVGQNKDVVDVMAVAQTAQVLHVKIRHKADNKVLFCSFVYASNSTTERRLLWADLGLHKLVTRNMPWVLMGYFNVALNLEDVHSSSSLSSPMYKFKDCVVNIEVLDINRSDLQFTWNQKPKGGTGILKKLDRVMGNIDFVDSFSGAYASKFLDILNSSWSCDVEGHNMFKVVTKMKALKSPLHLDVNPTNPILREEEAAYLSAFNKAKLDEERFLKQKAKIDWLEAGDSNSAYFHKAIKSKNSRSRIDVLLDSNNNEITGASVSEAFVEHYESFLGTATNCVPLDTEGLFVIKVSDQICSDMVRPISDDEIRTAMFDIGDDRAPGPDGFTSAFFKKGWIIVGTDVCNAVHDFFTNGQLLKKINHTFLALTPKKWGPPRCTFKVDIQKAYDTVDWRFLDRILQCFGFPPTMIKWIMTRVSSASFSLCINGNVHGYFKGKRGLRQGDLLSPYLFTLVVEILTLILKRRVHLSESFRFHHHCDDMELINVCFADDLFIFSRGNTNSVRVIMEGLDAFKLASGLVPSIPKSTAFFCNVPNYVKLAILNIMPFLEGKLPVKYLGVPLISSRLLNKDCKVLVDQAKTRIGDWKNKSLSFASRLQPCSSVISSMQAKITWVVISLPKTEGSLGKHSLEVFNIALMTKHIWNIISDQNSLWVRWIKIYKLRGRSFWEILIRADASWGWRKLLQIQDRVRPFFWSTIGNGMSTSLLFDNWCSYSPIAQLITPRDVANAGFNMACRVADLVAKGVWTWPQAWLMKAPNIDTIPAPILVPHMNDTVQWRNSKGKLSRFSVSKAWEDLRLRGFEVRWARVVWFSHWDVGDVDLSLLQCPLCETVLDSHCYLFFKCNISSQVWSYVRRLADLDDIPLMHLIVIKLIPISNHRTVTSIIRRLVVADTTYFIWLERNNRLFKNSKRSLEDVRDFIMITVRLKLLSFRFKNTAKVKDILLKWNMPNGFRIYES
ncbi:putative RNA-directed DNA polymerase [Tanacetum coccineum]